MKQAYDIYNERCPTRAVLDRIADKWALLILDRLGEGTARFNALKRAGPVPSRSRISSAHLSATRSSTARVGQRSL